MTYIIAEIASAHDGNMDTCLELMNAAIDAGANGVKFQVFRIDEVCPKDASDTVFGRWEQLAFKRGEWLDLFAQFPLDVDLWCEIYGKSSALTARRADYVKGDRETLRWARQHKSRQWIKNTELKKLRFSQVIAGRQDYPTDPETGRAFTKLDAMGYADHTAGFDESIEICREARRQYCYYIEKHIMPDAGTKSKDACSAIQASQFKRWCEELRA